MSRLGRFVGIGAAVGVMGLAGCSAVPGLHKATFAETAQATCRAAVPTDFKNPATVAFHPATENRGPIRDTGTDSDKWLVGGRLDAKSDLGVLQTYLYLCQLDNEGAVLFHRSVRDA